MWKICVHIKTCTKLSIEVLTTIAWKKKVKLKSLSHVWLCNPMDCSLTGSSIHGIFQARILEWVAISFSWGSSRPRDRTQVFCVSGRLFTIWGTRETLQLHAAAAAAKSLQSCPTLYDTIDGSPSGSAIPGILQTRTLEWVSISFSNAWKWKVKVKSLSHVWPLATPWTPTYQAPLSMKVSRQECIQ